MSIDIFEGKKAKRVADALESISGNLANLIAPDVAQETAQIAEAKRWVDGKDLAGNPVPSTAPQYENNAKYYVEQTEAAKTTAVQAIEAKGEQVLHSIPSEYTELSGDVADLKSAFSNRTANILESEETSPDLDIADEYGNVLARFENGAVETKFFHGFDYVTYKSASAVYTGSTLTLQVNRNFKAGDHIVLHIERGAMPWEEGAYVTYKAGSATIINNKRLDCAWIDYVLSDDTESISAVYAANVVGISSGTTVRLEVSLLGDLSIAPKIVKVSQDGSGDFTTLRGALDYIGTSANDVLNPYQIHIYPGIYDVLLDYSETEIQNAQYTQTGFVGPKLLNGISLIGIGDAHSIILTAALNPANYSSSVRSAISTLNIQGSANVENVTIKATDIRYCVHDDFDSQLDKIKRRHVKNCIFRAYGDAWINGEYGAATGNSGTHFVFENCDFGSACGVHNQSYMHTVSTLTMINCRGIGLSTYDYDRSAADSINFEVSLYGCAFDYITSSKDPNAAQNVGHIKFTTTDAQDVYWMIPPCDIYIAGNVDVAEYASGVQAGTLMKRKASRFKGWEKATSVEDAQGIVVYADSQDIYIQTSGIIQNDRIGIAAVTLGNYIGMDGSGNAAIVQSAENSFAKVIRVTGTGTGYCRIKWPIGV